MKKPLAFLIAFITCSIITLPLLFCSCGLITAKTPFEYIERETYVHLPSNAELIECTDSHGGFLGDGTMKTVIALPDDEETDKFLDEIKEEWITPPEENKKFYEETGKNLPYTGDEEDDFISYSETAYFFYRDRYYEMYGEIGTHSYNFTLACYYPETRTLKFLEVDT